MLPIVLSLLLTIDVLMSVPSKMSGDHDRCFSILVLGAFSTGVFNTNALPRINIGTDVWGESSIMTGVIIADARTLHIGWGLCDRLCPVLVCRGRYGLGGGVLLFILGSSLGGVGPERGLRGKGRRGWCEEWARSG